MQYFDDIKKIAKKCLKCIKPACVSHCPLNIPIPEILNLILDDALDEAQKVLFEHTNASFVCASLCDVNRQCYGNCILNKTKDKSGVLFYQVEAYLAQNYFGKDVHVPNKNGLTVAIIGAGISGISCAIDLAKKGFDVTIFEQNKKIGGVIYDSLPKFRFDNDVLTRYETILERLKVKILTNKTLGKNLLFEDLKNFNHVIIAMGTKLEKHFLPSSNKLLSALAILKDPTSYQKIVKNSEVLVIGGGNVAFDVARMLKRLDADVSIVYRRNLENAPASVKEINEAKNEQINFILEMAPLNIIENGSSTYLEVEKMRPLIVEEKRDSKEVSRTSFIPTGEKELLSCDFVVEAIGLSSDFEPLRKVYPMLFDENGKILSSTHFKVASQMIYLTGDYLIGASNFASATKAAKKTVQEVEESLCE